MTQVNELAELLVSVEEQLHTLDLWQADRPSAQALASIQPFCVDTLSFPQWLQFIFLPTIQVLIENRQALPTNCGIAPMAEMYFVGAGNTVEELLALLKRLDDLLSVQ